MATSKEHYEQVLANVYSWMLGGFEAGISRNLEFFQNHSISPIKSGVAVDLGAGCGFQSTPLAQLGFTVTAIDLSAELLNELQTNASRLNITTIQNVWKLNKSFYRKLRLSQQWVNQQLVDIGFSNIESSLEKGLVTVVATH